MERLVALRPHVSIYRPGRLPGSHLRQSSMDTPRKRVSPESGSPEPSGSRSRSRRGRRLLLLLRQ